MREGRGRREADRPAAVCLSGRRLAVEELLETWRIDDEWWRPKHIARLYWRALLEDGRMVLVLGDLWYAADVKSRTLYEIPQRKT